ncbi:MAG: 16S rRNA (guanine(527)-N(7))-methyltransferase RsmG [Gammaproteobacteria bacterium]|nr:16S rRNA (guanine(527)-N(7))-methyltransferase RsmG [Gammaproteobacteria bacterium]
MQLVEGAAALGVQLDEPRVQRLLAYVDTLVTWNRAWNLTAIRDPQDMLPRHLLDSLSVASYLAGESVVDVGTGAGLPGIPLAIADPARRFMLIDANGKKVRFVTHVIGRLGVGNAAVEQIRIEHYRPEQGFDTVLCRAFSTLANLLQSAGHLCAPGGRVIAMKGMRPQAEIDALPDGWRLVAVSRVQVPGIDRERHIVEIARLTGR